jgi:hypothetical protein
VSTSSSSYTGHYSFAIENKKDLLGEPALFKMTSDDFFPSEWSDVLIYLNASISTD